MRTGPVMIMAGGTGGHVFPGLAVAAALRERHSDVVWLGTQRGLEARIVPQHDIDIEWVSISGLRGKGFRAWCATPFRAAFAVVQVLGALRRRRPSAVLGMGGFVSGPGGIAAWLARKPLLIHEQNAVAGTTNRWLARFAARVFEGFPDSFPSSVQAECIGNPIRRSIAALAPAADRVAELTAAPGCDIAPRSVRRPRLLVLGGSQGARVLNRTVPRAVGKLSASLRPDVWHQAGAEHDEARDGYRGAGIEARVDAFIDDMAAAYGWADLVVARAGALTISELAAAGIGAVLVPYPHAIDDHQSRNAAQVVAHGGGVAIAESDLDAERLAKELDGLLRDPALLEAMARAARRFARVDAADRVADACLELARASS